MSHILDEHSDNISPKCRQDASSRQPLTPALPRHKSDSVFCLGGMTAKTAGSILRNASECHRHPGSSVQCQNATCAQEHQPRLLKTSIVEPELPPRVRRQSQPRGRLSPACERIDKVLSLKKVSGNFVQSPAPRELLLTDESDQEDTTDVGEDGTDVDETDSISENDDNEGDCTSDDERQDGSERDDPSIREDPSLDNACDPGEKPSGTPFPRASVRLHFERQDNVSSILGNKGGQVTKSSTSTDPSNGVTRRSLVFVDQSQEEKQRRSSTTLRRISGDHGAKRSLGQRVHVDDTGRACTRPNGPSTTMKSYVPGANAQPNRTRERLSDFTKWRIHGVDAMTGRSHIGASMDEDYGPCSVWASQHLDVEEPTCPAPQMFPEKSFSKARSAPLSGSTTRSTARSPKVGAMSAPPSRHGMDKAEELALVAEKLLLHAHSDDSPLDDSTSSKEKTSETDMESSGPDVDDAPSHIVPSPRSLTFHREASMSMKPPWVERGPRRLSVPASLVPVPLGAQRGKSTSEPVFSGPTSVSSSMSTSPRLQVGTHGISLVATPVQASSSTSADGFTSPIPRMD